MSFRSKIQEVVFESRTHLGRAFDIIVFITIGLSVVAVISESIPSVSALYGEELRTIEWAITVCFTFEYFLRLIAAPRPLKYVFSFYGLIDLLAVLPTYLSIFYAGAQSMMVLRAFRFLRIFRVFKLARFVNEASILMIAIKASRQKITVFMCAVLTIALVTGTAMYLIEGPAHGFRSIPSGIYWAIVTMTTVGYGDLAPSTPAGKILASMLMLTGYAIIAIPTGIVSVEIAQAHRHRAAGRVCLSCGREGHETDAAFCRICGERLS